MKSIAIALIASAALGTPVFAQDQPQPPQVALQARAPQPPQPPQSPQPPQRERQPAEERERTMPPPPPPAPPAPAERRPLPTRNVKVDVTITDQTGTGAATKKIVSLVVADGRSSSVRSMTQVATQRETGTPFVALNNHRNVPLNIDTYVSITVEQRVLLELKFNYGSVQRAGRTTAPAGDGVSGPPDAMYGEITENLWTLLNNGERVVVSRSADAASDRTVTVEVKAEILK